MVPQWLGVLLITKYSNGTAAGFGGTGLAGYLGFDTMGSAQITVVWQICVTAPLLF